VCYDTVLGSGSYKTVYACQDTETAIAVAWHETRSHTATVIDKEVVLLASLTHDNVVFFYGCWMSEAVPSRKVFITELMSSGTLKHFLRVTGKPKFKVVRLWCRQILSGLSYLHNRRVIHRDIKCDNIFINGSSGEVKIGDLGLATTWSKGCSKCSVVGTPEFMAPEMCVPFCSC
jgi:WNK lysine deficient protein kinase